MGGQLRKVRIKAVSGTIWVVGILLVCATLDGLPDPPVSNPGTPLCQILQLHPHACDTAGPQCDLPVASDPLLVSLVAADARQPEPHRDRVVLTTQASDSSPPA
jgi:hypothetical protein